MPRLKTAVLILLSCLASPSGAAPAFVNVTPSSTSIPRLDRFELAFTLSGTTYSNAYDPAQIEVSAVFTSPSAQAVTVNGFYMRDYVRTGPPEYLTGGTWNWKVRFSPRETGTWSYTLQAVDAGSGTAAAGPATFSCTSSSRKGFVKVNPSSEKRYLLYEDGSQFIPIGQNVGWANYGGTYGGYTFNYDRWIARMADEGANFARYWMCPWYHSLEWQQTGLGNYAALMHEAWRLDHDLELARDRGLVVMLALLNHGSVSSTVDPNWADSPYNAANGGPCADTHAFFTDATARAYWVRHLRYCVARWGYASNLIWELCNEIDLTDGYWNDAQVRADVASWHHDMAVTIRAFDAGRHLVTTSFSNSLNDPAVWNDPAIDYTQFHAYSNSSALEDVLRDKVAAYRTDFPSKPVHVGEFGISSGAAAVTQDPGGITWHNSMWGNLLGESDGSGASWWWDNYVDPMNLYPHFRGLSTFASVLDFPGSGFVFARPAASTGTYQDLSITPGITAFYIVAPANDFTVDRSGTVTPGVDLMSRYLYGQSYNTAYRNAPVTLRVDYPQDGQFTVSLSAASTAAANFLYIGVDGSAAYNGPVTANGSYPVSVGAGPRTLVVDSVGADWVQVRNFTFSPYVDALKAYALQGPSTIAAWLLNRGYNAPNVRAHGLPTPVAGTLHLTGVATDGIWGLEWRDTQSGSVQDMGSAQSTSGVMDVPVPTTVWDRGLILRYVGTPTPTHTPCYIGGTPCTPTVTFTPTDTFTPTLSPTPTSTTTPTRGPGPAAAVPNVLMDGATRTTFRVPEDGATLRVVLYTLIGERAAVIEGDPGTSRCFWDASEAASGLYLAAVHVTDLDGSTRRWVLKVLVIR